MGWPQWTIAVILFLNVIMSLALDGKPRRGHWSFSGTTLSVAVFALLLHAGGFWR